MDEPNHGQGSKTSVALTTDEIILLLTWGSVYMGHLQQTEPDTEMDATIIKTLHTDTKCLLQKIIDSKTGTPELLDKYEPPRTGMTNLISGPSKT